MKAIEHVGLERTEAATHSDHFVHVKFLLSNGHHVVFQERRFEHSQRGCIPRDAGKIDSGDLRAEGSLQRFDSQPFRLRVQLIDPGAQGKDSRVE